jgi:hypothetical protein
MKLAPKKNVKLECLLLVSLFRLVHYFPNISGIPLCSWPYPKNRLGLKDFVRMDILAYWSRALGTKKKCCMTLTPGLHLMNFLI